MPRVEDIAGIEGNRVLSSGPTARSTAEKAEDGIDFKRTGAGKVKAKTHFTRRRRQLDEDVEDEV